MKALLFDLDGTLIDRDSGARNWAQATAQTLLPAAQHPEFLSRFLTLDAAWPRDKLKVFSTLENQFQLSLPAAQLVQDYRENVWRYCTLFGGVQFTLQLLINRGYLLAIISNGSSVCQSAKISGLGLDTLVKVALISEAEGLRKPDPRLFWSAAARLGVKPEECFVVGDSAEADIAGGAAAGMKTIWIEQSEGWTGPPTLRPDFTITSVSGIPHLLGL